MTFFKSWKNARWLIACAMLTAWQGKATDLTLPPLTNTLVYIGTFTGGNSKSEGIYVCHMDASGVLSAPALAAKSSGPGFVDTDARGRFLYAVKSVNSFEGKPGGALSAFSIDPVSGSLKLLNERACGGSGPCHVVLDHTGKFALVANYGNGSETVLPIKTDGMLAEVSSTVQFEGHGPNADRQQKPHAHGTTMDAGNRAYVCDLGTDKVMIYHLGLEDGKLKSNDPAFASVNPGAGPRHLAFHPNGQFAYVINEMQSTITTLAENPENGSLRAIQTVSTLPAAFTNENTAAEIAIHPSGKFVYGSNRGHNSIAVFKVDPRDGTLSFVQHQSTKGRTPRGFGIDPTGNFLIAANQDSDNMVVFRIQPDTGRLESTGQEFTVGSPVCIKFVTVSSP